MDRIIGRVELDRMEFFAHHGCFEEEQVIGNKFIVTFSAKTELSLPAHSDNIEDALNYQSVYNIIKKEMMVKSHLLEHVALRILNAVKEAFPYIIEAEVSIEKLNPPLGGQVRASRVVMSI